MTRIDFIVAILAAISFAFHLGWWAGARWRRAHDAARYAQIDLRRDRAYVRRTDDLAKALAAAADAGRAFQERPQIIVDYSFAVDALQRSGYDVTPSLKPTEKH